MKPVRLQLQGFTAFHDRVTVDFSGRHLFAITGPTGAGKSSLLDGMIWALFGKVPRVSNRIGELVSHGALLARVQFEFEAHGQRYTVARVRPVKGQTTARLERLLPTGDPVPVADSVNEVNSNVERILGIDYETFVKTIILPQGEFSAFLSGDPKDKKSVLSRLLGLDVYRAMMQSANNRSAGAKIAAEALQQQHDQLEFKSPDALRALEAQLHAAEDRQRQLAARRADLDCLDRAASGYAARWQEASAAALAVAEATRLADVAALGVEEARGDLEAARAAHERLDLEIAALDYDPTAHDLARQQHAAAERVTAARARLEAAERTTADARATKLRAAAEAELHARATAEAQQHLARARAALTAAATPAAAVANALDAAATAAEAARADAERQSHDHELRAKQLQHLAAMAIALRRELESADADVQRATAGAALATASRVEAEARLDAALAGLESAQHHLEAARTQHAAAAILATLAVGDPCPVCGEPITSLAPHTAPDLAAAEAALEAARQSHAAAQSAHQRAGNDEAAAAAHLDAARTVFASVETKLAGLDEQLAEAATTRAGVDRAAKRASSAAAAERDRAVEARRRADLLGEAARRLHALLVKLPPDLPVAALEAPVPDDVDVVTDTLAPTLEAAIEDDRGADACLASAAASLAAAEATVATAAAEAKTAIALQEQHRADMTAHTQALVALGAPADALPATLRAALDAMDALAGRSLTLAAELRAAEQQHASKTAVLAERTAVLDASTAAVATAEAACAATNALAGEARVAFEAEWRRQIPPSNEPDVTAVPDLLRAAEKLANDLATEVGHAQATLEAARGQVEQAQRVEHEAETYRRQSEVAKALALELQANKFVAYIQQEAMQVLAADAADRMLQLSRDRYRLEADGDEFVVVDRLNGDERRSVRTLSGGETFLASLALALALSERLPELSGHGGALSLESLFLDEGFGSLDAESLDVAIQGLELLATGNRMIGVISHVLEVAERLPDRIEVVKVGGASTVRNGR